MSRIELKLDYKGAINNPENTKQDFRKAMTVILLSVLSSGVLSVLLYFVLTAIA